MSDFNTEYVSGLSGGHQSNSSDQNRKIANQNYVAAVELRDYAKTLERRVADLEEQVEYWMSRAVAERSHRYTQDELLKRKFGKTARDLTGVSEADYKQLVVEHTAHVRGLIEEE